MYQHFNSKFQRHVYIIHPGEYYATKEDVIISTVLGSCVAVVLYDTVNKFGGMNHFMLSVNFDTKSTNSYYISNSGKYGMYAMELLINDMLKKGAKKSQLIAKVFGGGTVLRMDKSYSNKIPQTNIDFAFTFLETEGIPIKTYDVGGDNARKVFLFPKTARILLKRIERTYAAPIQKEEKEYLEKIKKKNTEEGGEITLF